MLTLKAPADLVTRLELLADARGESRHATALAALEAGIAALQAGDTAGDTPPPPGDTGGDTSEPPGDTAGDTPLPDLVAAAVVARLRALGVVPGERRRAPARPRPGGSRQVPPPADPPDRRTPDRLTEADLGEWVREDGRRHIHRLATLSAGGTGTFYCGEAADLRVTRRASTGTRCARCSP